MVELNKTLSGSLIWVVKVSLGARNRMLAFNQNSLPLIAALLDQPLLAQALALSMTNMIGSKNELNLNKN